MGIAQVRELLEAHDVNRLEVTNLLMRVRDLNEGAQRLAIMAWHEDGDDDRLVRRGHEFTEVLVQLFKVNEKAQDEAQEIIRALGS